MEEEIGSPEYTPRLPDSFMKEWLPKAEGSLMFGIEIATLSKEELMASLAFAYAEIELNRDQHRRDLDFMRDIKRARRG